MTRADLEKYHDVVVRLKILKTTVVTDSVVGSSPDYPYVAHSITLHGVRRDEAAVKEIDELTRKKAALDAYIDGIEDVRAKSLLDLHYRKGKRWVAVASDTGYSADANEKYLQRFFRCL